MVAKPQEPSSVALLWHEPRVGRRGPRPALTVEALVEAGIELADDQGLDALSMERVAKKLKVTTMALYRYVPSRAVLVDLMVDRGVGSPPKLAGPWRRRLLQWANALLEIFRRHPWSLESTGRIRVMGPFELSWLEAGMAALASTSLTPAERRSACLALISQVRTAAQFSQPTSGPYQHFGWEEWTRLTRALIATRPAHFPELSRVMTQRSEVAGGLDWVLDGIAARLEQRAHEHRADR